jgi:polyvinyl alcohol dehydrogenase (cytochrome)
MRPKTLTAALTAVACTGLTAVASVTAAGSATSVAAATLAARTVPAVPAASGADWTQYNSDAARTGGAVGVPAAGALSTAWNAGLDGAVYGQPLVIGNAVIAATENNSLYAVNKTTGKLIWRKHVGAPVPQSALHGCGDIFPLGITGTPVYDAANGLVYAVAETTGYHHMLVGVSAATGAVKLHRNLDIPTTANQPAFNQQRPALTINGGRVYAAFGGLAGDCGAYQGSVVSAPLAGNGPLAQWKTPTSREGAIWGTAGPVTGPNGALWVATGNGAAGTGDPYDGSDSVTELTPALQRTAFFAPSTWAADNDTDLDLGSTQPARVTGGAVFVVGKRGVGYLLDSAKPGGIGGQLAQQSICAAFGGVAVSGTTVFEPCSSGGLAAISLSAAKKTIKVLWRGPADANGSPVIGGGSIWVTHYANGGGTLYALDPANGSVQHQVAIAQGMPHFSSLSLSGNMAYVSTLKGFTAIKGA